VGITGTVRRPDGTLSPGATIFLRKPDYLPPRPDTGSPKADDTTDTAGGFWLKPVSPGDYWLEVSDHDTLAVFRKLYIRKPDSLYRLDISLERTGKIVGVVGKGDGALAGYVRIPGTERSARVAGDGSFTLANLPLDTLGLNVADSNGVSIIPTASQVVVPANWPGNLSIQVPIAIEWAKQSSRSIDMVRVGDTLAFRDNEAPVRLSYLLTQTFFPSPRETITQVIPAGEILDSAKLYIDGIFIFRMAIADSARDLSVSLDSLPLPLNVVHDLRLEIFGKDAYHQSYPFHVLHLPKAFPQEPYPALIDSMVRHQLADSLGFVRVEVGPQDSLLIANFIYHDDEKRLHPETYGKLAPALYSVLQRMRPEDSLLAYAAVDVMSDSLYKAVEAGLLTKSESLIEMNRIGMLRRDSLARQTGTEWHRIDLDRMISVIPKSALAGISDRLWVLNIGFVGNPLLEEIRKHPYQFQAPPPR
jgi:hypothetical protein